MGNPAPQSRSNSPKTNVKPKHRRSGSVSNISFNSEDPKPKHRHSGSVSNIALTPEDLKPKHRQSGSVSNISLTPEDLKPKHRHSGSISNISITPLALEDVKDHRPKHRRSGSVSSTITSYAEDFSSPIRRDASRSSSPSSSIPSSSSAASLKEKRIKRRTRSSLGGTDDFVKELDFLTTLSPNGRTPDSYSTRKEHLNPSPSPALPESLQAAAEELAPVPEASVPVQEVVAESPAATDQLNDLVFEKASVGENGGCPHDEESFNSANAGDTGASSPHAEKFVSSANVGENGGSPHDEKSVGSAEGKIFEPGNAAGLGDIAGSAPYGEESVTLANVGQNGVSSRDNKPVRSAEGAIVQPGDPAQLAASGRNGVDGGSIEPVDMNRGKYQPKLDGHGAHEIPDKSLSTLENGSHELHYEVLEEILPVLENGKPPETAAGLPLVGTVAQKFDSSEPVDIWKQNEAGEAPNSIVESGFPLESIVAVTAGASFLQNTTEHESGNSDSLTAGDTARSFANGDSQVTPRKEEKLSQEEQAAKDTIEGQKVSVQKRIQELEKIAGGRPVHFRSQSLSLPRPFDVSHARHHEAEASKGLKMPAYKAPLESTSVSELSSSESAGTTQKERAERPLQREGSASTEEGTLPTTGLDVDETSAQVAEPQKAPGFSVGHKAVDLSPDRKLNGIHLENGRIPESFEGLNSANHVERMAEGESNDIAKAHSKTVEENAVETGMEKGLESGLGEVSVLVSADSVPKELRTPTDHTEEYVGESEIVEPPPGAPKEGTTLEEHEMGALPEAAKTGMLPVAHQSGTLNEVPSVQAPVAEQSSHDYETTVLLTKQPAVDPLFVDSQQDRLWEMHSQELTIGESSGQEVRESSAQDDDPRQYLNGTPPHAEVTPSGSAPNGKAQSDKSGKVDRPRTPLRSLLAEEDAEKCPDSGPLGTPPQNQSVSPRGNLFKRIVSGGKNSPTKQTTPTKFSPKNQTAAKPFLSSCICCSVK
ncbi:unnamed protein product [Calypogeia fissa]